MTREVEFLEGVEPGDAVEDPAEQSRRVLSWRGVVAAAAAAAMVAALLLRPSEPSRAPTPAPTVAPPTPAAMLEMPPPDPFGSANITLTFGGGLLFGLSPTRLGVLVPGADGVTARRSRSISLDPATQDSFRLVWDDRHATIWVVPLFGRQPGVLREYGTNLELRGAVSLPDIAHSATVLDGVLYVSTNSGIVRVSATGAVRRVPLPHRAFERYGSFGDIVADPARSRLLYVDYGYVAHLATWSPRTRRSSVVRLPMADPTVAVVGRSIWAAGFRKSRASVQRLDPDTLRPVAASAVAAEVGPGAVIVAAGRSSILVRSGTDPDPLWCVDAATGAVRQRWSGPEGLVSGAGRWVFVAASPRVTALPVSGCPG